MNRLKKYIVIFILSLPLLLIGCTILDEETPIGGESGESYIKVDLSGLFTRADDGSQPVVNSVRLLVFSADKGKCLANEKYDISTETQNLLPLAVHSNLLGKTINVYAVVNENGYCSILSEMNQPLGSRLETISLYSDESTFLNLMQMPLSYSTAKAEVTTTEPAFVIYAYDKNIQVKNSSLTENDPYIVYLTAEDGNAKVKRSMAKITIDKITGIASSDVAKIFVKDIQIVNIPTNYSLSTKNDAGTGTEYCSVSVGEKDSEYFDRKWNGTITSSFARNATVTETTKIDARCYRQTAADQSSGNWKFELPTTAGGRFYSGGWGILTSVTSGKKADATTIVNYLSMASGETTLTGGSISASSDSWTLSFGKSVYVPENLSKTGKGATAIQITLVVATPRLDIPSTSFSSWSGNFYTGGLNNISITSNNKDFFDDIDDEDIKHCKVDNLDDIGNIDAYTYYYQFIDNFQRTRTVRLSTAKTFSGKPGVTNSDGTIAGWDFLNTEKTFTIYINDNDYTIKRNTHYQISLEANAGTYSTMPHTRAQVSSAEECPLKASVKVSPLQ